MSKTLEHATTSIQDELSDDHRRLNQLFERLVRATWALDPAAAPHAHAFEDALVRHIRWEEDHLFPAVLADVPLDLRRHIESLRADHELLQEIVAGVGASLARKDFATAKSQLEEFTYYLAGHNDDEELGLYREADRHLEMGERRDLIARFHESAGGHP